MSVTLNIGLSNTGHLSINQAIRIAFHMIGGINIAKHKVIGVEHDHGGAGLAKEPTMIVELFNDIAPGLVNRIAIALNQDCIAYYNADEDVGLLIGPRPYDRFQPRYFLLMDGLPLDGELRAGGAA